MNPEFPFVPPQATTEPPTDEPTVPPPSMSFTEPATEPVPDPTPEPENEPAPAAADGDGWRFVYGYPTTYPNLGLTFEPGDVHDWPDGPPTDGRWTPATPKE